MYTLPKPGTILPAKQNTTIPNPGPVFDVSLMQQWLEAQMQQMAFDYNLARARDYVSKFWNSWYINYWNGSIDGGNPDTLPLQPPSAYVIVFSPENGFDLQPSGQPDVYGDGKYSSGPAIPVCPVPTFVKRQHR